MPDNLKTGVVHPDLYDPKINRRFGELAAHYGSLIDPARMQKPRDKAHVERPVPYGHDSFFAGRAGEFRELVLMQEDAIRWCKKVANRRSVRPLGRVAPTDVFEAEEQARQLIEALSGRASSSPAGRRRRSVRTSTSKSVPGPLLGAMAPHRRARRHKGGRTHHREVHRAKRSVLVKTHIQIEHGKQTEWGHGLDAEDRLLHAHPGLVPKAHVRAR